jgi:6-phosphogluconolactonase
MLNGMKLVRLMLGLLVVLPVFGDSLVYIGTYTRPHKSEGIYAFRMDASGKLTPLGLAAKAGDPSFVAIHPSHKYLYAIGEAKGGTVSAYSIDAKTGKLTLLNTVPSKGAGPCYVAVDKTGKVALIANYGGGSVAALAINADGSLGDGPLVQHHGSSVDPERQKKPYGHSFNPSPDNRFAIAADLGMDEVLVYKLGVDKNVSLATNKPPFVKVKPGSGPRHFSFHPNGRFGYVINEMASTVTAFSWDAKNGVLKEIQTITTLPPEGFKGETSTAEVLVHPSGKFLYGSNRGHDSIAVFSIDAKGMLTPVQHQSTQGKTPRNFGIDPTGSFLIAANQDTDNIVVFKIDQKTGRLTPTGQSVNVGNPVCVRFMSLQ